MSQKQQILSPFMGAIYSFPSMITSRSDLVPYTVQTVSEKRSPLCTLFSEGHRMVQPETVRSKGRGGVFMGIVVVRSPRCLRGLLRRIFKVR